MRSWGFFSVVFIDDISCSYSVYGTCTSFRSCTCSLRLEPQLPDPMQLIPSLHPSLRLNLPFSNVPFTSSHWDITPSHTVLPALFSSWYFLPLGILNSYVFYFVFVSPLAIHFVKVRILPVLFTAVFQHLEKCLAFTGLLADICWMNEWTLDCLYCDKWPVLMFATFCWLYLCTFWTIVLWILSNLTVNSYMRRK